MRFPPLPEDDLRLPDLQAWVAFFPPEAWEQWDRLYEAYRGMKKLDAREGRVPEGARPVSTIDGALT